MFLAGDGRHPIAEKQNVIWNTLFGEREQNRKKEIVTPRSITVY